MNNTAALLNRCVRQFEPPPEMTVSQWAEQYFYIPFGNASPGLINLDKTAYMRGILDAFSNRNVEKVSLLSSSQIGKTTILLIIIGYYSHYHSGTPILMLNPTLDASNDFSKDKLTPMFEESPVLKPLLKKNMTKDSGNTLLKKRLTNRTIISMAGTNSPASLAARSIKLLLCDEVDRYPDSAGEEGSPLALAVQRTKTFPHNRKILISSTPTIAGASAIEKSFSSSLQHFFYVPCPTCKHYQLLKKDQLKWPKDDQGNSQPQLAKYHCSSCNQEIEDRQKPWMLKQGEWRSDPNQKGHIEPKHYGYYINELYSPWVTFSQFASDWVTAVHKGSDELRVFTNTHLGECFNIFEDDKIITQELSARREYFPAEIPKEVGYLTLGADVQSDRLEVQVLGHSRNDNTYVIGYHVFPGDPSNTEDQSWVNLDNLLHKQYKHESGNLLNIAYSFVDCGYLQDEAVTKWTKPRQSMNVRGFKGSGIGDIVNKKPTRAKNGAKLYVCNTNQWKDKVYAKLKVASSSAYGYVHFPLREEFDLDYFYGLTCEVLKIDRAAGNKRTYQKKKPTDRNEPLDTFYMALAAAVKTGLNAGEEANRLNDNPVIEEAVEDQEVITIESDQQQPSAVQVQFTAPKRIRKINNPFRFV